MSRNKYPEETVKKILEVSLRLFLEKGYDNTTIQDIVDALGMSKGAIYHHFKSKEDIITRLTESYYNDIGWFQDIIKDPNTSGLEKLQKILLTELTDGRKLELDQVTMDLLKNPRLVAESLNSSICDTAPMLQKLVEEGNADGSLHVAQPKEATEALIILLNLWIAVFATTREDCMQKIRFLKTMSDSIGMPLIDEKVMTACETYFSWVLEKS